MRKIGRAGLLDHANRRVGRSLAGGEELSGLGKLAFASLWLLVFAMSWEDAITIAKFGTTAHLIAGARCPLCFRGVVHRSTGERLGPKPPPPRPTPHEGAHSTQNGRSCSRLPMTWRTP